MRWLMIGFLVSLGALLLAVAGMARHIHKHRKTPGKPRSLRGGRGSDLEPEP